MGNRKFFTGDEVIINHYSYPAHDHHRALVAGTRITRYLSGNMPPLVSYRVDCECGASLLPLARHMDLVSTVPTSDVRDMRRRYFLAEIGVHSEPGDTLDQQVDAALGILKTRQRTVIVQRFGLADDSEGGRTLQAIADAMHVSRQYISQVEARALRKLTSFPGLVKGPV
jgi:hypothetical protein